MKIFQKIIKYCALAFAILLIVMIFKFAVGSFLFVGSLFDENQKAENLVERDIAFDFDDYDNLNIKAGVNRLTLKSGDRFSVVTNNKDVKIEEGKDVVIISDDNNRGNVHFYKKDLELIVTLPTHRTLDSVSIEAGVGKVLIEELDCKNAIINLGVGGLEVNKINVTNAIKISGGVGKITVHDGRLNNLEADLSVGKLSAILSLTGENKIKTGIGGLDLELLDSSRNYTFKIEKDTGDITLNKDRVKTGVYGNGVHTVGITGGIGEIKVTTADKEN